MIDEAVKILTEGKSPGRRHIQESIREILEGTASQVMMSAFLVGLRMKGEEPQDIIWAVKVMRDKALKINIPLKRGEAILDTCGTGGSRIKTFNVSTATAFVVAGCGVKVAKHGNRSASSLCGSADVLEFLGVNINAPAKRVELALRKIGIGFLYAPLYHSSLKFASPVRRELKIRTLFNILGPLCNPVGCTHQLLGVYEKKLLPVIAQALRGLNLKAAMVVCSQEGIDEISITGKSFVQYLNRGKISGLILRPRDFGKKQAKVRDILGPSTVKESASLLKNILRGKDNGPCRDMVEMNASCCLFLAGRVKNFKEGVKLAQESIDSGKAWKKFQDLKRFLEG